MLKVVMETLLLLLLFMLGFWRIESRDHPIGGFFLNQEHESLVLVEAEGKYESSAKIVVSSEIG